MEERISFAAGDLSIEGILKKNTTKKGVVLAHPHPLYGGNMFDFVVEAAANAFWDNGYSTLKFNFRGVGKSQGRFDNGQGEQEDLKAAIAYLAGMGLQHIDLAGYSFGTWVISQLDHKASGADSLYYISPPMGLMNFGGGEAMKTIKLIVTGSLDEYAPPSVLKEKLEKWNSSAALEVIEGSDHFYGGFHLKLQNIVSAHLKSV